MPIPSITLAEFNKIASGQQNAGQVDFKTNSDGEFTGGLVKINNHIIRKSLNGVHLTGERVVAIKEAFLDALQKANVRAEDLQTIRGGAARQALHAADARPRRRRGGSMPAGTIHKPRRQKFVCQSGPSPDPISLPHFRGSWFVPVVAKQV